MSESSKLYKYEKIGIPERAFVCIFKLRKTYGLSESENVNRMCILCLVPFVIKAPRIFSYKAKVFKGFCPKRHDAQHCEIRWFLVRGFRK